MTSPYTGPAPIADIHPASDLKSAEQEYWLSRAQKIAADLLAVARTTPSGGLTWIGPRGYGTEFNPLRVVQLNTDMYDGVVGIALFFAYLARVSGDAETAATCLRILAPIRRWAKSQLATSIADPTVMPRVGGLMGIGSLIYAFERSSELLGEPKLHAEALALVDMLTPERIANDLQGRIQTGSAGTILALLALPPEARDERVRSRTRDCAERLLELRVVVQEGAAAWAISTGKAPLLGLLYGAAGVGHALSRLDHEMNEPRWRQAVDQADAFVRLYFAPDLGGYIDPRAVFTHGKKPLKGGWRDWWASGKPEDLEILPGAGPFVAGPEHLITPTSCHGSAGVAAARIAALEWDDCPEFRQQIEVGLHTAAEHAGEGAADLCCGDAGRIDVLLLAARHLKRPELYAAAAQNISRMLAKADAAGGHFEVTASRGRKVFAPTLFQGVAGVGYALLRAVSPELPCLLVLE